MSMELIENIDYEIKETLENLISKMKQDILEVLCVIKFLIKQNEFEYANKVLLNAFQDAAIGDTFEEIRNLLKRIKNDVK
ncbi:hypothetical protein [Caminibacter pacificus]